MNNLTLCRAHLIKALRDFSPIPVRKAGNPLLHPSRLYAEIRIPGSKTNPVVESRFTVIILIIATPSSTDNVYQYIDVANQFHDYLQKLALQVPTVGCLVQDGVLKVDDFGFVDKAETIKQATVTCEISLEY